jgi:hypothetical protein
MFQVRRSILGAILIGVALGSVGCGGTREPYLVILPTYSYVRAGVDLEAAISPPLASVADNVGYSREQRLRQPIGKSPPEIPPGM